MLPTPTGCDFTSSPLLNCLPGLGSINAVYSGMGWTQSSVGRWLPPGTTGNAESQGVVHAEAQLDQLRQASNPRASQVADMWRTSSWSDFRPRSVSTSLRRQRVSETELIRARCGAPAPTVRDLFRVHLADIPVEVHADENVQDRIGLVSQHALWLQMLVHQCQLGRNQLPGRGKTAKVRKGLTSVFNFVPFYLDQYVSIDGRPPARLIYLDTDTVIMVKYCLQSLEKYVDFRELGYIQNHDPKACIANRGLLVIDVRRWHELQITEQIEMWMQRYAESKRVLWKSGVSQPPWLLAMGDDFLDLGDEWNCNSLGREKMPYAEALFLRDNGFDHAAVRKLGAVFTEDGGVDPFVVIGPQTC
eukprot:g31371.t1